MFFRTQLKEESEGRGRKQENQKAENGNMKILYVNKRGVVVNEAV